MCGLESQKQWRTRRSDEMPEEVSVGSLLTSTPFASYRGGIVKNLSILRSALHGTGRNGCPDTSKTKSQCAAVIWQLRYGNSILDETPSW